MVEKNAIKFSQRYLDYFLKIFFSFLAIVLFTRFFIISPGRVNGSSMEPNFVDNQIFFVNKHVYLLHEPERGDVVQIIDPVNNKIIIKRIVGLPGEEIKIINGNIYIKKENVQEEKLNELHYLKENIQTTIKFQNEPKIFQVRENEYFVLGDNRSESIDSRYFGPVFRSNILGKVIE